MTSEPMTVAVVGATGFVGSHVVPHLATAGHHVIAVSRKGERRPEWGGGVIARAADVSTGTGLEGALEGADAVVHLVAIPRETGGRTFEEVNVRGTGRVVIAAEHAGVRRIVHLSVLGVIDDPKLAYLGSKWRGEQLIRESALEWVVRGPRSCSDLATASSTS